MLGKYLIGELQQTVSLPHYEQQGKEEQFYTDMKKDVHAYFVENKVLTHLLMMLPCRYCTLFVLDAVYVRV